MPFAKISFNFSATWATVNGFSKVPHSPVVVDSELEELELLDEELEELEELELLDSELELLDSELELLEEDSELVDSVLTDEFWLEEFFPLQSEKT